MARANHKAVVRAGALKKKKSFTIHDVAAKAGVAVGTVSGVLSGKPIHSPKMVARVRAIIRETGFKPRRHKDRLQTTGFRQFGLLYPEPEITKTGMSTPLAQMLVRGIDEIMAETNDQLIVTQMSPGGRMPICIEKHQVEGLIIRSGDYPDSFLKKLRGIPSVWAMGNRPQPKGIDSVGVDNVRLGSMAAEKFLATRAKRVLLVHHDDQFNLELVIRNAACEDILRNKSIEVKRVTLAKLPDALRNHQIPTAVFVPGHDAEVIRIYHLLAETGHRPCGKTPIVCAASDMLTIASLNANLHVLSINPEAIGRAAARQLLWRISHLHEPPQTVLVSPVEAQR